MYIYVIYIFFFRFFSLVGYYKRLSSLCSTVGQFYLHGMGVWEAPTKPPPHRILSHPGTFLFDLHAQVIFPSQVRGDLPVRPAPAACSTWVAFLEDWLGFCTPPTPFSTSCFREADPDHVFNMSTCISHTCTSVPLHLCVLVCL